MESGHVAFFLEQAYGHVIPTLGVASELRRRGHRVSYAVNASLARGVTRCGARAVVFEPMETRTRVCQQTARSDGTHDFRLDNVELTSLLADLSVRRTEDSVAQLSELYKDDRPDLVIHDDCLDIAGKTLALRWGVKRVFHLPHLLTREMAGHVPEDDEFVLVPLPRFFNEDAEFDARFKVVGFIPEGRREFFGPWEPDELNGPTILVSPTTGLLPQIEFCKLVIRAFEGQPWRVVLSLPTLDPVSAIDPATMPELPDNFRVNLTASNLDILEGASLFIGSGGVGSTLEALYCGVPALLIPFAEGLYTVAGRVAALGLGASLRSTEVSAQILRESAAALIAAADVRARVKDAQRTMHADRGAELAADLIENQLRLS